MYFSIYPSCEYNSDDEQNNNIIFSDNDLCLICWLPEDKNNKIKLLSDFSHIKVNCKCNPKIHGNCLNDWITKSKTCPICRTEVNLVILLSNNKNFFIHFYIISIEYTICLLKILSFTSLINLFFLMVYNMYKIYFMTNTYYQDDYGIY